LTKVTESCIPPVEQDIPRLKLAASLWLMRAAAEDRPGTDPSASLKVLLALAEWSSGPPASLQQPATIRPQEMRMRALIIAIPAIAAIGLGAAGVASQERHGRYLLNPVENGFVRLDTETGAMSVCTQRNGRWVCVMMGDEAKALQDEVECLRAE